MMFLFLSWDMSDVLVPWRVHHSSCRYDLSLYLLHFHEAIPFVQDRKALLRTFPLDPEKDKMRPKGSCSRSLTWLTWLTCIVSVPLALSESCDSDESSESSLFQAVRTYHDDQGIAMNKSMDAAKALNQGFDLPMLQRVSQQDVGQCVFHACSGFVRSYHKILGIACDYSSTTRTLPLSLVKVNNFTGTTIQKLLSFAGVVGNGDVYTDYSPMLSPDFLNATTYIPYAVQDEREENEEMYTIQNSKHKFFL